jgi:putative radical SAM enzyme (TIGR03279 family)
MKITDVRKGSIAEELGIRTGDRLLEINNQRVQDSIGLKFFESDSELTLKVARNDEAVLYDIEKDEQDGLGLVLEEMNVLSCGNDCIFCFVDQNPAGMRNQLYFRDGDYRLSFLYGNYTTMTNAGPATLRRIIDQRLSPQYISVHVTDYEIRKRLMGLKKDDRILEKIKLLHDNGIDMHTQIVLCPGINDGEALQKTVRDLSQFSRRILSLAVVPVGLTDHRDGLQTLKKVDGAYARGLLGRVKGWQAEFRSEISRGFIYPSDEFFLLAGRAIPPKEYYDGFPQIENGVGMVRSFHEDFKSQARGLPRRLLHGKVLTLATGELPQWFVKGKIVPRLERMHGLEVRVEVVPNALYGRSVTVAGLLSGKCLYSALQGKELGDLLLLPPDILNADGMFLDDGTLPELETRLGVPTIVFDGSWSDVFTALQEGK